MSVVGMAMLQRPVAPHGVITRPARLMLTLLVTLSFASPALARDEAAEQAAMATLDAFMAAFNARDLEGWRATLHYPHVRIASGKVAVAATPADYASEATFAALGAEGWHHSAWADRRIIHSGPDKVHIAVRFVRYREDGSELSAFDSLYIVTKQATPTGEHWGVQARSSYAP